MAEIKSGSSVSALVEQTVNVDLEGASLVRNALRLARIVSVLMEEHPLRECAYVAGSDIELERPNCARDIPLDQDVTAARWCPACRDRALLERCDRIAEGEGE